MHQSKDLIELYPIELQTKSISEPRPAKWPSDDEKLTSWRHRKAPRCARRGRPEVVQLSRCMVWKVKHTCAWPSTDTWPRSSAPRVSQWPAPVTLCFSHRCEWTLRLLTLGRAAGALMSLDLQNKAEGRGEISLGRNRRRHRDGDLNQRRWAPIASKRLNRNPYMGMPPYIGEAC